MSILFENDIGILLSTEKYFNKIIDVDCGAKINSKLFEIHSPYSVRNPANKRRKEKILNEEQSIENPFRDFENEILDVQNKYFKLLPVLRDDGFLKDSSEQPMKNNVALITAASVYEESGQNLIKNSIGSNFGPATIKHIQNAKFIFPENCQFFCKDVNEIDALLSHEQFDMVLLDPPWWNKYIRRKRKRCPYAYDMMFDCDLKKIPIENLLNNSGIVVVWCTNSPQHLKFLLEDIFPKWKVDFVAKWYWLKVTIHGEPICEFSKPPGKQPFEQILIGCRDKTKMNLLPTSTKLLMSVPSAIHSHKPPLTEVLQPFLPENPKCLEIFARYLLPNWTSYGHEVLRFQHESLYTFKDQLSVLAYTK